MVVMPRNHIHLAHLGCAKNLVDSEIFLGHFPQQAVLPGVMIIEALAQTAGLVINSAKGDTEAGTIVFFAVCKYHLLKLVFLL